MAGLREPTAEALEAVRRLNERHPGLIDVTDENGRIDDLKLGVHATIYQQLGEEVFLERFQRIRNNQSAPD